MKSTRKPKLAVWKFSSCDGCQLSLLDCEDELLAIADAIEIAHFPEATRRVVPGPYDLSLVEGSITTPGDARRIQSVRKQSKVLVSIGACAVSGGVQALRNHADAGAWAHRVYPRPEWLRALPTSTNIASHVKVDFELPGCPVDRDELLEVISAFLNLRKPALPTHSVCGECKRRGVVCLTVAHGTPCLGPATRAGCGAICPAYGRGCFGCHGPSEASTPAPLTRRWTELGMAPDAAIRAWAGIAGDAPSFRAEAERIRSTREERT
ncbi:MAG: oxidoreductase [Armatimonadota bacterium]